MEHGLVALALSSGTLLLSVFRIFMSRYSRRIEARIKRGNKFIEINLEKPEQAELFIRDYLSRHPYGDVRAKE